MPDRTKTTRDHICTVSHSTILGGIFAVEIRERFLSNEEAYRLLCCLADVMMDAGLLKGYSFDSPAESGFSKVNV